LAGLWIGLALELAAEAAPGASSTKRNRAGASLRRVRMGSSQSRRSAAAPMAARAASTGKSVPSDDNLSYPYTVTLKMRDSVVGVALRRTHPFWTEETRFMTEPTEHPRASKMMVAFLRLYADMSQTELAQAARLSSQSRVSEIESGDDKTPSEDVLRRIAAATGVRWELVTHLRRFINGFLFATERAGVSLAGSTAHPESLAVLAYLLEDEAAARHEPPAEARLAAERFWKEVAGLPSPRRRRLIELSPRASKSWALAELLCHESERAAADDPREALELAELALSVAGRVEGKEEWKRLLQGYAWAFVGNARRVAKDHSGAGAAFAKARELWRSGAASEAGPLQEERMPSLEAPGSFAPQGGGI